MGVSSGGVGRENGFFVWRKLRGYSPIPAQLKLEMRNASIVVPPMPMPAPQWRKGSRIQG